VAFARSVRRRSWKVAGPFHAFPAENCVVQRLKVQPVALVDWEPIQSVAFSQYQWSPMSVSPLHTLRMIFRLRAASPVARRFAPSSGRTRRPVVRR
jgi:hypothetical protein